jgi:tetratricopeptide (TPR) repeat protein
MTENRRTTPSWAPAVLFFGAFAVYLFSAAPALAPYRDMGEMVSVTRTLGVAHPPGYPLYTLMGRLAAFFIPFANASYALAVLSALGGAFSGLFLYLLLVRAGLPFASAFLSAGLWVSSPGVWTVSQVTEMYSLHLAAAFALLYLWVRGQSEGTDLPSLLLLALCGGLALGIRLDLVLILPGFALAAWLSLKNRSEGRLRAALLASAFFALGFAVYLYLPVRSSQEPWLNWSRPDTLEKLWNSLTRKSHGGTLDLLSVNYAPGQLFTVDLMCYLKDFGRQFYWVGIPLALLGLRELFRKDRALAVATVSAWILSGPFFLYKANLPPNPHALAILEAHFLLPNVLCAVWVAFGLAQLETAFVQAFPSGLLPGGLVLRGTVAAALVCSSFFWRWEGNSKRQNFFGVDYARNVLATLPPHSILIMQKDVQLFLFWALQYAEGVRPDVSVVARGLSGSPWYIQMKKDSGSDVHLGALRSDEEFSYFLAANPGRRVFAGWEEEVPYTGLYRQTARGLVREIGFSEPAPAPDFFREFYVYRGLYRSDRQKEFFSSDLVSDYAKGYFSVGAEASKSPATAALAAESWNRAIVLDPQNAAAYVRRALLAFQEGRYPDSILDFSRADRLYQETARLTQEYYSLPGLVSSVREEWSDALLNLGVAYERSGRRAESESAYLKALSLRPNLAQAHYNIAVLYWNRDWEKVARHLEEALKINPGYAQAAAFLAKARYALERSRGAGLR